jgi:hypothetical protein
MRYASLGAIMKQSLRLAASIFLLPGNMVADLLGAAKPDDRAMILTMIDMLFWNIVVVNCAVVFSL